MAVVAEAQFHVLAVDDSLMDRKLIERLLKTSSFQGTKPLVMPVIPALNWFPFLLSLTSWRWCLQSPLWILGAGLLKSWG